MSSTKCGIVVFAASLLATLAAAQAQDSPATEHKWKDKLKSAVSSPLAPIKTMPPNAIVVLDPGVDPKGEPKPLLRKTDDGTGLTVEVPETVHVHRYFPCGSREFQAQYFAGGPTIVSVRHPFCGERVYVHIDLPPGFPVVKYEGDKIEYKYPEESLSIHFDRHGGVSTSYNGCPVVKKRCKESARKIKEKCAACSDELGVNHFATKVGKEVRDTATGTVGVAGTLAKQSTNVAVTALNLVPGLQMLKSAGQDRAIRERDRGVKLISEKRAEAEADIPTLR